MKRNQDQDGLDTLYPELPALGLKDTKTRDGLDTMRIGSMMKKLFPYLIIVIVGIGAFYQVLHYEFVWDDLMDDLLTNPYLQEINWESLGGIWHLSYWDKYIPVTFTIRAVLKLAGGNEFNPFIYHLFSLVMHILNSLLVFLILKKIIRQKFAALAGALLFLIHPMQVESVAWVTANEVLIASFWGFVSLLLFMKYKETGKTLHLVISVIGYGLSILSRTSLIGLPLIFMGLDLLYYKSRFRGSLLRQVPYIILMIPGIIIQMLNQPGVKEEIYSPILLRPVVWLDNLGFFFIKIILPFNLRPVYGHVTEILVQDWKFYLSAVLMVILAYLIYRIRQKKPLLVWGYLVFVIAMLPVSGLVPFVFQNWSNVADRYIYFSLLGVSLAIGVLISKYSIAKYVISGLLIVDFVLVSAFQVPVWENDVVLWQSNIKRSGENVSAYNYNNLGIAFQNKGEEIEALSSFEAAIEQDSTFSSAFNNRGLCYFDRRDYAKAEADFRKALELNPAYPLANYNLGRLFKEQKEYNKSEQYLQRALKQKPNFGDAYNQLGFVYAKQERWQEADLCFTRAKQFSPYNSGLYNNLGLAAEMRSDNEAAIRYYQRAISLDANNLNAYNNRANLYYKMQNYKAAIADFDVMTTRDSLYLEAFYNRGTILLELERYDLAVRDFGYVIVHDSLYTDAWLNRSISFYHLNELEAALYDAGQYMNLGGEPHPGYQEALAEAMRTNFMLKLKKNEEK
ncbi:MAG: tetratricopeptide repeat protein [Candidatus Cloacimonetes bacterium]|nr:tetratricopeptide repeat protein [Candidatus Cloacimonadota bacterium]